MPHHDYILFIKSYKSQKWSTQNEAIFGGKNQKNAKKKFKKIFIVPNDPLGHADQ